MAAEEEVAAVAFEANYVAESTASSTPLAEGVTAVNRKINPMETGADNGPFVIMPIIMNILLLH
jgi:hypothetical protein